MLDLASGSYGRVLDTSNTRKAMVFAGLSDPHRGSYGQRRLKLDNRIYSLPTRGASTSG
jgi:hypothetical protein